jgi:hypothetical protein
MYLKKTIVTFVSSSKDIICCSEVKFLDLHLDAKSYIEGLEIIFNMVINQ